MPSHKPEPARDPAPVVTVIVPALNAAETILPQLRALMGQVAAPPFEVLVVDNGSSDGTQAVVRSVTRADGRVRLLEATARRGVNVARSAGARAAKGSLLLYCDADDVVDSGWIREMARALQTNDLVGGRIDEHALNTWVAARYRTPRMETLPRIDLVSLAYAPGGCLGIRADVLNAVGGWNVSHPMGMAGDDIELSWRCQLAGYRLGFAQRAVVHYRYRSSLRAAAAQSYRFGYSIPLIFSRVRHMGRISRGASAVLTDYVWTVGTMPRAIVDRQFRRHWVQRVAFLGGRLAGSARLRVLCL